MAINIIPIRHSNPPARSPDSATTLAQQAFRSIRMSSGNRLSSACNPRRQQGLHCLFRIGADPSGVVSLSSEPMTRILVCLSVVALVACGGSSGDSRATSAAPPARPAPVSESLVLPPVPSPYDVLPTAARERLDERFTGDLDGMV